MEVLRITTVYGDKCHVRADDFRDARKVALRLTTADGTYLAERVSPATGLLVKMKPGACKHIVRANIASYTSNRRFANLDGFSLFDKANRLMEQTK